MYLHRTDSGLLRTVNHPPYCIVYAGSTSFEGKLVFMNKPMGLYSGWEATNGVEFAQLSETRCLRFCLTYGYTIELSPLRFHSLGEYDMSGLRNYPKLAK